MLQNFRNWLVGVANYVVGGTVNNLAAISALFSFAAFGIYIREMHVAGIVPNYASWVIWAGVGFFGVLRYFRGTKDLLTTLQVLSSSVMCLAVWGYGSHLRCFGELNFMDSIILILCLVGCILWAKNHDEPSTRVINYGMLVLAATPTVFGVWHNSRTEKYLPWLLWSAASLLASISAIRTLDRTVAGWWHALMKPICGVFLHTLIFLIVQGSILNSVKSVPTYVMKLSAKVNLVLNDDVRTDGVNVIVFSPSSGYGIVFNKEGQPTHLLSTKKVDQPQNAKGEDLGAWLQKSRDLKTIPAGDYPYRRAYDLMLLENFRSSTAK